MQTKMKILAKHCERYQWY